MELSLAKLLSALLTIGARISGLMLFMPFFSHSAVPIRIKAALVASITAVLYPVVSPRLQTAPPTSWPWLLGSELLVGIVMGIATNLVFEGVQMAGHVMSVQMGYSLVNILDPQTQVDTTVISVFTQLIAVMIFLALDVHHWILRLLTQSFETIPPGTAHFGATFTGKVAYACGGIFSIGVQIAAPVLTATIVADLLLGLLSKAAPQLPILFLGPGIKAMLSVVLLSAALPYWPRVFAHLFQETTAVSERLLLLAR